MEVKTFLDMQITPLMLVSSQYGKHSYMTLRKDIDQCGLWESHPDGGMHIPNLMTIIVGFGYDINSYYPDRQDEAEKKFSMSIVTPIPAAFYEKDLSVGLTKELADSIQTQTHSFFENYDIQLKTADGAKVTPLSLMQKTHWSYMLAYGARIVPYITLTGNIDYGMTYDDWKDNTI